MPLIARTIETTGIINAPHQLLLDESLPIADKSHVRVIIMMTENTDITESEWLKSATKNPAFDFLKAPEEDIYTLADGKTFND